MVKDIPEEPSVAFSLGIAIGKPVTASPGSDPSRGAPPQKNTIDQLNQLPSAPVMMRWTEVLKLPGSRTLVNVPTRQACAV